MKRLICLSVTAVSLTLAGCGKESDELPVDGREFDGVEYSQPAPYTGKVIDGYLNRARVWLDMDGDSQYTPGPLVLELDNGREVTLTAGEPTAMSGPGGVFSLDISGLVLPPGVGPDLDPRDYPLFAVAIPGTTLEETRNGDVPVARAYLMSAAPGNRNLTPLTTLDRYRQMVGLASLSDIPSLEGLAGLNLVRDYILAGDERAHAYARALARFMASQLPDEYNTLLAQPGSAGTERFLSKEAAFLLGVSLVQNAGSVADVVDAAAGGGNYANVDADALALPEVTLELTDPVLLTRQLVYAEPASGGTLPASTSGLEISAELAFDYTEDGRIRSVSAQGCMAPTLREIARVIRVNGRMGVLETQWLPSASLSAQSRVSYEAAGTDERLVFDWDAQTITFDTVTSCHLSQGAEPESSELGGTPEIVYSWTRENGVLASVTARYANGAERILTPRLTNATEVFPGYGIEQGGAEQESVRFLSDVVTCAVDEQAVGADQVVTGVQSYAFAGYEPQPSGFTNLEVQFDTRTFASGEHEDLRLLSYGFLDPLKLADGRVTGNGGFKWAMRYPVSGASGFVASQPNLIQEAFLRAYTLPGDCGREFEAEASSAYARVVYSYETLSDYLVGLLQ